MAAAVAIGLAITAVARRDPPERPGSERGGTAARNGERGRGRGAAAPTDIPARGWWDILLRVKDQIAHDRTLAVAAGVTFYGLLALFPAMGAFVSLYGLFSDPSTLTDQLNQLSTILPGGAMDILGDQLKRLTGQESTALGFAFFTGLAASLWSANAGMKAVFDALNVAYDEEEKRNFFVLNLWALGCTAGAVLFLLMALSAVVVVPVVLSFLGLGAVADWLVWIGRWPALLLLTLIAISVLYRVGPSREDARWRWVTPGSLLAAAGWLVFSMLFSWYVGSFGNYNQTYGSLGAVIGFMTWLWLSTTILLVGATLNAETEHQTARDTTTGPSEPQGRRGAAKADTVGQAA